LYLLIPPRHIAVGSTVASAYLVALVAASIVRNMTWQDPATLWADAAVKSPASYRARNNLGRALIGQGQPQQAAQQFNEAIRINPNYAEAHNNLGTLHARGGRFEQARKHLATAIELNPRYAEAYNNLGVALLSQGLAYDAAVQLAHAVRLAPGYAKAHANLATALIKLNRQEAACRHLFIAKSLDAEVSHSREDLQKCPTDTKIN
jgi:Flp pilus assembly protein TadD